jgi:hypothetical protein
MAPWTILFRSIEDALYQGADRLSALLPIKEDVGQADDPLFDDGAPAVA